MFLALVLLGVFPAAVVLVAAAALTVLVAALWGLTWVARWAVKARQQPGGSAQRGARRDVARCENARFAERKRIAIERRAAGDTDWVL